MKLQLLAACAALATFASGAAFAADPVTAKLATPLTSATKFIAGGAMFSCEADNCVASVATSQTFASATCRIVADKVGVLTSFEGRRALEADKLSDCNAKAVAKAGGSQLARR